MRLGVLTSHPIQYQAPWFRALAREVDIHVYFAHRQSAMQQADAGYGVAFDWDIKLLEGYDHTFLRNVSRNPNVYSFGGCDTPDIGNLLRRRRCDALLINGWYLKSYLQALYACKRIGIPTLVRGDSQLATPRSRLRRIGKAVGYRILLRAFDACLYVGARAREYFLRYGVQPERLFPAPHFVDNAWFAERAREARERRRLLRRQFGLDEPDTVALFVGRFVDFKRPCDLIRATAQLSAGRRVRPVFVGAGPLEGEIRRTAGSLGVDVKLLGFRNQTELPSIYAMADFLVLCSGTEETWGLVVNEAMACGIPSIVSAAAGCAPDLVDAGQTGYSYPVGDVAALAAAIEALLPRLGSQTVTQAIAAKLSHYSCEQAVNGTLAALRWVTQQRS